MSKTIEEAAREAVRKEYLCELCAYKDDCDLCGGENTAFDCCECPADSYGDGFKAGANYVYGLPLSSRLTPEEKERVRAIYNRKRFGTEYSNEVKWMEKQLLEHLFGSDFFKEGK